MLILVTGLPGSGKTTIARFFSTHSGALHLNSDFLRRELGLMGNYKPEDKERVYSTLLQRAKTGLLAGRDVIVDSTFYKESFRTSFRNLAEMCRVPLVWVEVCAQESTIRERLKKPRADSEADFSVYEKIKSEAEPLTEPHLVLWSDEMSLDQMVMAISQYMNTAANCPT